MHSEGRPVSGPDTVSDDARVLACVLRRLLRGDAPSPAQIGAELDLAPGKTEAVLARLHAAGVIDLVDGALRAAYPLSAVPTRHRLRIGSATAYANCAVDALAVPAMVAEPVAIESTCPQCGASIVVRTHGERLLSVRPEGAVVYLVSEACGARAGAVRARGAGRAGRRGPACRAVSPPRARVAARVATRRVRRWRQRFPRTTRRQGAAAWCSRLWEWPPRSRSRRWPGGSTAARARPAPRAWAG